MLRSGESYKLPSLPDLAIYHAKADKILLGSRQTILYVILF